MASHAKKKAPPTLPGLALALPERGDALSARDFVAQVASANASHRMSFVVAAIAEAAGISRGTLHNHVTYGRPVREGTARALQEWSGGWVSGPKTLGM